jgi:hypothetical protein
MCEVLMSLKYCRFSFVKVICGVTHCQCGRGSGGLMCLDAVAFTANGALMRSQDWRKVPGGAEASPFS